MVQGLGMPVEGYQKTPHFCFLASDWGSGYNVGETGRFRQCPQIKIKKHGKNIKRKKVQHQWAF